MKICHVKCGLRPIFTLYMGAPLWICIRTNNKYKHIKSKNTKLHMIDLENTLRMEITRAHMLLEMTMSNISVRFQYHMMYWPNYDTVMYFWRKPNCTYSKCFEFWYRSNSLPLWQVLKTCRRKLFHFLHT